MQRDNTFYIVLVILFLFSSTNYANFVGLNPKPPKAKFTNAAPIITASGNQIYCAGTYANIVTTVTIADPSNEITEIFIQISAGYVKGQDQLILNNPGSHPKIGLTPFNSSTGKLRLYSIGSATAIDFEAAVKDIQFHNSSTSPSGTRNFSITIGQANYLPSTQHYYQFIPSVGITWTNAKVAAESDALKYYGLRGYLATILSAEEAKISGEQASGAGWIGGSDAATEGVWKWVTGPEGLANGGTGTIFWYGLANGSTPNFAFWNINEPNQYNGAQENYAHVTAPGVGITGSWNDLTNTGDASGPYQSKGYIVEYGGMPGDPVIKISASTTITIPNIVSTTPATSCPGVVNLKASASNGTINWYATPTSSNSLHTGNSFNTPYLTTTTTYYVDAGCPSSRIAVVATINTVPNITSTNPSSVCDSGTVTLGAIASAGTVNWYNAANGGISLATGPTFTTAVISATTTFYVDATENGCTSPTRTAVIATVNNSPSITSTTTGSRCDSGSVNLEAIASAGTINWYSSETNGTLLGTGTSFTTPNITTTTTYYAEANSNGCKSPRISVTATIYPLFTISEEVILCQGENATLDASVSGMKYLWSPNGETTQTIVVSSIGNYSVTISSPTTTACDSKKNISVMEHPKPIINSIVVNENSITIELAKSETFYEYSINGIDFQVSNQFSYIPTGQYTAFVRENNGCNLVSKEFTILTLSKFFTPNNDSYNDTWGIKGLTKSPLAVLTIFDRYGKYITTLTPSNPNWDGTLNGTNLPASDYWFIFKLDNETPEVRGHFALKR